MKSISIFLAVLTMSSISYADTSDKKKCFDEISQEFSDDSILKDELAVTILTMQGLDEFWKSDTSNPERKCGAFRAYLEPAIKRTINELATRKQSSKAKDQQAKAAAARGQKYLPDSCQWYTEVSRRVLESGGKCKSGSTAGGICTGYVVCDSTKKDPTTGGLKQYIRISTCSSDLCGEDKAAECTKQQGYFSAKPLNENKEAMAPSVMSYLGL
jgi:hypothetical protein